MARLAWTRAIAGVSSGAQNFNRNYTPYDGVNRLSTMSDSYSGATCTALSFTYDAWGNRWQTPTGGTCPQWNPLSYTSANQPVPTGGSYTFDPDGRMTNDGSHQYFYDAENHLVQIDGGTPGNCSSATACYVYDANGRRVEKTTGGVSTLYLHDLDGNVQLEMIGGGYTLSNEYVYFNNSLAAVYAGGTSGETLFVHPDHLGSTRLVTDYTGCIVDNLDYFPFGELTSLTPLCTTNDITHKFTSKERDSETGFDNFVARYYWSGSGRFLSPDYSSDSDPVPFADLGNPQSLNLYSYVLNNPLTNTDPDGHDCFSDADTSYSYDSDGNLVVSDTCSFNDLLWDFANFAVQLPSAASSVIAQPVLNFVQQPRDPACMASTAAAGTEIGAGIGLLGYAGGPAGFVIDPTMAGIGGAGGLTVGTVACMSGTGGGGGSGGSETPDGGGQLSPAARKKLGNLASRAAEKVRDVIRSRGGSGSNVNEAGQWADRILGEAAQAAVEGNPTAETAVKIAKQAGRLGQKY